MIGSLGDIVFRVTDETILTPYDIGRSGSARKAKHEPHGAKPRPEHVGPGDDEMTLSIRLDRHGGVEDMDPLVEVGRMRKYRDSGDPLVLIFGEKPMGRWTIDGIQEEWRNLDHMGRVNRIDVTLTLGEWH